MTIGDDKTNGDYEATNITKKLNNDNTTKSSINTTTNNKNGG